MGRNLSTLLDMTRKLSIGFVRRGYSQTGGAEAYLKRLARGVVGAGHDAQLITTNDWPQTEWPFGTRHRLQSGSVIGFANGLKQVRPQIRCDVLMSLERVWNCDVYRAGDGVHRAWLARRRKFEIPLERFIRGLNRKHRDILQLEGALFANRGAGRVIVNSQMVKSEIIDLYRYPADNIALVRNGIPLEQFRFNPELREKSRDELKVKPGEIALLFAGAGWGNQRYYKSKRIQFLGEMPDLLSVYAAADIFILPTIYDPFSNACLEALACGLPIITTRSNGFSEIIEDKVDGSIVDHAGNLVGLRDAIRFWSDPPHREAAHSTNIERASQFDISKNVEQTLKVLTGLAL